MESFSLAIEFEMATLIDMIQETLQSELQTIYRPSEHFRKSLYTLVMWGEGGFADFKWWCGTF